MGLAKYVDPVSNGTFEGFEGRDHMSKFTCHRTFGFSVRKKFNGATLDTGRRVGENYSRKEAILF